MERMYLCWLAELLPDDLPLVRLVLFDGFTKSCRLQGVVSCEADQANESLRPHLLRILRSAYPICALMA